jgi:hypothetical protein
MSTVIIMDPDMQQKLARLILKREASDEVTDIPLPIIRPLWTLERFARCACSRLESPFCVR